MKIRHIVTGRIKTYCTWWVGYTSTYSTTHDGWVDGWMDGWMDG